MFLRSRSAGARLRAAAAALLAAGLAGCRSNPPVAEATTVLLRPPLRFASAAPRSVEVQFHSGSLVLVPDKVLTGELEVDVTGPPADVARFRDQIAAAVTEEADGSFVRVTVPLPSGAPLDCLTTRYRLGVPPGTRILVQTRDGAVTANTFAGRLDVRGGSGRIVVDADGAELDLATTSGGITVGGLVSGGRLRSGSGAIELQLRGGVAPDRRIEVGTAGTTLVRLPPGTRYRTGSQQAPLRFRPDPDVRLIWSTTAPVAAGAIGEADDEDGGTLWFDCRGDVFVHLRAPQ